MGERIALRAFASRDDMLSAIAEPTDTPGLRRVPRPLPAGVMWRTPEDDRQGREAWAVILSNGNQWSTTEPAEGHPGPFGWEVTGTPPLITVTPSIDDRWPGNPWHGWIINGELVPA